MIATERTQPIRKCHSAPYIGAGAHQQLKLACRLRGRTSLDREPLAVRRPHWHIVVLWTGKERPAREVPKDGERIVDVPQRRLDFSAQLDFVPSEGPRIVERKQLVGQRPVRV